MASDQKMEMEFGVRVATHSILKDLNNGCQHNLVFSPLSLHTALNLLTAGAKGPTLDQLLRFLDSENITQLHAQSSIFMQLATDGSDSESPSGSGTAKPLDETPVQSPRGSARVVPLDEYSGSRRTESYQHPLSATFPFYQNQFRPLQPPPPPPAPLPFYQNLFRPPQPPPPLAPFPFYLDQSRPERLPPPPPPPPPPPHLISNPPAQSNQDHFTGSGPVISMVNGIWVDQRFSLKHSFKQLAEDIYKAKSESVDFQKAEQVASEINMWAREASKGHIHGLVSPHFIRDSILVLASALYFKGSWLQPFEARDTGEEDFRLLNGKRVRVPFMKQYFTRNFYRSFEGFKLLKMDYKKGKDGRNYAMHIFLPDEYDGLQELIQKFHSNPLFFTSNQELHYVTLDKLWLPKLKYDYQLNMNKNMRELGLDLPFQPNAEFTEIVDHPNNVFVSNVIQKSYIEVNEEGTIATSITAIICAPGCAPMQMKPPPSINFVADHPFLFVIKEEKSGIVLFVGVALNPLK